MEPCNECDKTRGGDRWATHNAMQGLLARWKAGQCPLNSNKQVLSRKPAANKPGRAPGPPRSGRSRASGGPEACRPVCASGQRGLRVGLNSWSRWRSTRGGSSSTVAQGPQHLIHSTAAHSARSAPAAPAAPCPACCPRPPAWAAPAGSSQDNILGQPSKENACRQHSTCCSAAAITPAMHPETRAPTPTHLRQDG